jgi:hypothetical protein
LQLAREARHEAFLGVGQQAIDVVDDHGRSIPDAQLFALAPRPHGGVVARFLGVSGQHCRLLSSDAEIVAFSNLVGAVASVDAASVAADERIRLRATGSARLRENWQPLTDPIVELRFHPTVAGAVVQRPTLFRLACRSDGWIVHGLPVGSYAVEVSTGAMLSVDVHPGQIGVID